LEYSVTAATINPIPNIIARPRSTAPDPPTHSSAQLGASIDCFPRRDAAIGSHSFVNWTQNGKVVSTPASYTFTMPSASVTLTAHFK
jgi:hypothetical protein